MNIRRDSQNAALLVHLAQGKKLTRLSALVIFGVQNITGRITELRDLTHQIVYGCPQRDGEHSSSALSEAHARARDWRDGYKAGDHRTSPRPLDARRGGVTR